jgi:cysteinyl-tRNA synthetase
MSKSLKNFISIKDYLASSSTISDEPAIDFRIYCLQHRYQSALHFSDDRIIEAKIIRQSLQNYLSIINKAITHSSSHRRRSSRPSTASMTLTAKMLASDRLIDEMLRDDINTPEALQQLIVLLGDAHQYARMILSSSSQSDQHPPIEPLIAVDSYARKLLQAFGLEYLYHEISSMRTSIPSSSGSFPQVIDLLVDFRSSIRANSLQASKALAKLSKSKDVQSDADRAALSTAQENLSKSMKLCDELRDVSAPAIGIRIEDIGANKSIWRSDSTSS